MLNNLNTEQKEVINAPFGNNLIIASAGTGKTSTIVGRIYHLLNIGVEPEEILLLTFTSKAAFEMVERLNYYFPITITNRIESGTFHAVAYRYLKKKMNISLKMPKDLQKLFRGIYDKYTFPPCSTPPYKAGHIYSLASLWINSSSLSFEDFIILNNENHISYCKIYNAILEEFNKVKRECAYASYDDLLLLYKEEIHRNNIRFCEILVDEYQDTNYLQNSIIESLDKKSLFCVGDYDQSIYAFNGSDIGIISSFKDKYKGARIFNLSKNYRSSQKILNIANNVISNNLRIYPKALEVQKYNENSEVELFEFSTTIEQYKSIASHIASSPTPLEKIAIIFRNNITSDYIEAALREFNINCKKKGAMGFFESREVNAFISILTLLFNPKDILSFINILCFGPKIGESTAKEICDYLLLLGEDNITRGLISPKNIAPKYENQNEGLFDVEFATFDAKRFDSFLTPDFRGHLILSNEKLDSRGAIFLNNLFSLFKELENIGHLNLDLIFKCILKSPLFLEIANSIAISRIKNKYKAMDLSKLKYALENIFNKIQILRNLSKSHNNLEDFLNSISLNGAENSSGSGVNLLTIHASKGLEFDDVYSIDLMDGRFPNTKLMAKLGSLEEERRLFYVATTRAKNNLYFSFARLDSQKDDKYYPSRFLKEAGLI